jgi:hypothetical protein
VLAVNTFVQHAKTLQTHITSCQLQIGSHPWPHPYTSTITLHMTVQHQEWYHYKMACFRTRVSHWCCHDICCSHLLRIGGREFLSAESAYCGLNLSRVVHSTPGLAARCYDPLNTIFGPIVHSSAPRLSVGTLAALAISSLGQLRRRQARSEL